MSGLSVLLVDDDVDTRQVLAEGLRSAGHSVREANHGQQALELMAAAWRPHLIVLDLAMPVMDGLAFLKQKRQMREIIEIPVVVLGGTAETPIEGAQCVLRKPIDLGDLISVISRQTQKAGGTSSREDTDESLRKERQKSDREVDRRLEGAAGVADAVIEQARDDADEVLRVAREAGQPSPDQLETQARVLEDATIQRQRAVADVKLADETRERTRALAALFALERELTDQHLLAERNRADLALNNRDDFLGMVAHDLRGFMAEIAYRAAMLARDPRDDEAGRRSRQMGEGIQRSTAGMKRLVSDLLDIAAIEAGRLHVEAKSGDLASVLRDAGEPFRFAAEAKGIALELEELPDSALALFDHDRVVQVLGNLVSNAIKFTPGGGRISILLDVASNEARVTVADTGAGIPADRLEAIFERFTQLRADRRGLGLGLYISRCLVEAQRGRIWATSVPGAGSKLSFTLPLAR
jgi:signal transduction histidine kinase